MDQQIAINVLALLRERTQIDARKQDLRRQKLQFNTQKKRSEASRVNDQIIKLSSRDDEITMLLERMGFDYSQSRRELELAAGVVPVEIPEGMPYSVFRFFEILRDDEADAVSLWLDGEPRAVALMIETIFKTHPVLMEREEALSARFAMKP